MIAEAPDSRPSRERPRGADAIATLFEREPGRDRDRAGAVRRLLDVDLASRYGGELAIPLRHDRPTVVANFVETIDGVVALDSDGRTGGGEISGFSPTDRFVMGVLRALADVVLVGARTVRASNRGRWTPDAVSPGDATAFARLRARLGLPAQPTTLIATGTGDLDPGHRVFGDPAAPVVVAAPAAVIGRLRRAGFPAHVEFAPADAAELGPRLVAIAATRGARVVLTEGGPHLVAALVGARAVDELFLTLAPQLAGRDPTVERLGLLEGLPLWPDSPRWVRLASARRAGDHLLLRYLLEETAP